ncbi:MAG: hypothetical protein AAF447_27810, partial [Myxococcota bacterium]
MPRLDGLGLCRALAKDPVLADVPVVLLSWKEDFIDRLRELRAGAHGYLRKEAEATAILEKVREVLRPRARLEAQLRAGGEVRGRVEGVGVATLLRVVQGLRPEARVSVRDAAHLFEIEVHEGLVAAVTRTGTDGGFGRGERALDQALGLTRGRFVVRTRGDEAPVRKSLATHVDEAAARVGARVEAISGANLDRVAAADLDEGVLVPKLKGASLEATAIVDALRSGRAPAALAAAWPRATVEGLLVDLARAGALLGLRDDDGRDLVAESASRRAHRTSAGLEAPSLDDGPPAFTLPEDLAAPAEEPTDPAIEEPGDAPAEELADLEGVPTRRITQLPEPDASDAARANDEASDDEESPDDEEAPLEAAAVTDGAAVPDGDVLDSMGESDAPATTEAPESGDARADSDAATELDVSSPDEGTSDEEDSDAADTNAADTDEGTSAEEGTHEPATTAEEGTTHEEGTTAEEVTVDEVAEAGDEVAPPPPEAFDASAASQAALTPVAGVPAEEPSEVELPAVTGSTWKSSVPPPAGPEGTTLPEPEREPGDDGDGDDDDDDFDMTFGEPLLGPDAVPGSGDSSLAAAVSLDDDGQAAPDAAASSELPGPLFSERPPSLGELPGPLFSDVPRAREEDAAGDDEEEPLTYSDLEAMDESGALDSEWYPASQHFQRFKADLVPRRCCGQDDHPVQAQARRGAR